jgi:Domain of unknown function (DUF4082)
MISEAQGLPACDDHSTRELWIASHANCRRCSIARSTLRQGLSKVLLLLALSVMASLGNRAVFAQTPVSLFGNAVPANSANTAHIAETLGVKFWSSEAGTISAIRFYRRKTSPSGYVARLYTASGGVLGSAALATESGPVPGWQTAVFPAPIHISAKTSYVAAYYSPSGRGASDHSFFKKGWVSGPLRAPSSSSSGGNGVLADGVLLFPVNSSKASNYYVDVMFTPAAGRAPFLSLSFEPPSPSISNTTPLGATVATIIASWSNGEPFTGTLGFGSPYANAGNVFAISGSSLIINPSGPGVGAAGGTVEQVTIVATGKLENQGGALAKSRSGMP